MDKIQILVIGRNLPIVQTMVRLVNNNIMWNASFAITDAEALNVCKGQQFRLVLLGGGISADEEVFLRKAITDMQPNIKIIQHYGGGSGLLATEINMALDS